MSWRNMTRGWALYRHKRFHPEETPTVSISIFMPVVCALLWVLKNLTALP
jgi:hypothetical protein